MDYYSIVAMEPHTDNVRYRFVHRIALEFG